MAEVSIMAKQTSDEKQLAGVVGYFSEPHDLIEATRKLRDAKYRSFDAFTPYPVHGLEAAQGLRRSPLPYVTFAAGLAGSLSGFLLQYWTSAVDWPLNVGGKPFNSWPAFVPVMFEATVLFAGLCTVAAMFIFNGLPNMRRRIFDPGLTRDKFALFIEAPLNVEREEALRAKKGFKKFDESEAADFLKKVGAKEVKSVYNEGWF